jgi:hypothetical protein
MKNLKNKIFISYNGGSGGDFFTNSCNGIELSRESSKVYVNNAQTIKLYEDQIRKNSHELPTIISSMNQGRYISTHMIEPLIGSYEVINIIMTDNSAIEMAIQRQMTLQRLKIEVNPKEYWFRIVRDWCLSKKYNKAAKFWYEKANQRWKIIMKKRISYKKIQSLNFNSLFYDTFIENLIKQGWNHNIDILKKNHKCWLNKKQKFTKTDAIESMSKKLSLMNWDQESGIIKYIL